MEELKRKCEKQRRIKKIERKLQRIEDEAQSIKDTMKSMQAEVVKVMKKLYQQVDERDLTHDVVDELLKEKILFYCK